MALLINEECIACAACLPECPNEAIIEGDIYIIDPDKCTECIGHYDEPQCVAVCPVDNCCVPDPNRKESKEELKAKYDRLMVAKG